MAENFKLRVRQIIRDSQPNSLDAVLQGERRRQCRYGRVMPVLFVPTKDDGFATAASVFGLTRDISDTGICVITPCQLRAERGVIGIQKSFERQQTAIEIEFDFLSGIVCETSSIGGDFWQTGIRFDGLLDELSRTAELTRLAKNLLPANELEDAQVELGECL